jgi:hypothetical protein
MAMTTDSVRREKDAAEEAGSTPGGVRRLVLAWTGLSPRRGGWWRGYLHRAAGISADLPGDVPAEVRHRQGGTLPGAPRAGRWSCLQCVFRADWLAQCPANRRAARRPGVSAGETTVRSAKDLSYSDGWCRTVFVSGSTQPHVRLGEPTAQTPDELTKVQISGKRSPRTRTRTRTQGWAGPAAGAGLVHVAVMASTRRRRAQSLEYVTRARQAGAEAGQRRDPQRPGQPDAQRCPRRRSRYRVSHARFSSPWAMPSGLTGLASAGKADPVDESARP